MIRHWHRNRGTRDSLLHQNMTPFATNLFEPVLRKYSANLAPGENSQFTQPRPRGESQKLRNACAFQFQPDQHSQETVRPLPEDFGAPTRWNRLGLRYRTQGKVQRNRLL